VPLLSTTCRQFHQHFTRAFFVQNFAERSAFVRNFGAKNALSYEKRASKMLMKLTPSGSSNLSRFGGIVVRSHDQGPWLGCEPYTIYHLPSAILLFGPLSVEQISTMCIRALA